MYVPNIVRLYRKFCNLAPGSGLQAPGSVKTPWGEPWINTLSWTGSLLHDFSPYMYTLAKWILYKRLLTPWFYFRAFGDNALPRIQQFVNISEILRIFYTWTSSNSELHNPWFTRLYTLTAKITNLLPREFNLLQQYWSIAFITIITASLQVPCLQHQVYIGISQK